MAVEALLGPGWQLLGAPKSELQLEFCLPTGQSFRWRQTGEGEFTGVIGARLVVLRQLADDVAYRVLARGSDAPPEGDAAALRDYLNLDVAPGLQELSAGWAERCKRFRAVSPHFPGARMLRQDPHECLFQFICSSNNHISRIHGMVERLCSAYGTLLVPTEAAAGGAEHGAAAEPRAAEAGAGAAAWKAAERAAAGSPVKQEAGEAAGAGAAAATAKLHTPMKLEPGAAAGQEDGAIEAAPPSSTGPVRRGGPSSSASPVPSTPEGAAAGAAAASGGLSYYAFPTLEQLSAATEEELRAAGFGYRAKFVVGSVAMLRAKPGGGRQWLLGLREVGLEEAVEALSELPGIGPKVAACIALFSLDKHAAIPVDTHVWQIAVRYYRPQLASKSLTKKVHAEVQAIFVERFGPFAGWAHNTLFISELANQQHRLPPHLQQGGGGKGGKRARGTAGGGQEEEEEEGSGASASGAEEAGDAGLSVSSGEVVVVEEGEESEEVSEEEQRPKKRARGKGKAAAGKPRQAAAAAAAAPGKGRRRGAQAAAGEQGEQGEQGPAGAAAASAQGGAGARKARGGSNAAQPPAAAADGASAAGEGLPAVGSAAAAGARRGGRGKGAAAAAAAAGGAAGAVGGGGGRGSRSVRRAPAVSAAEYADDFNDLAS